MAKKVIIYYKIILTQDAPEVYNFLKINKFPAPLQAKFKYFNIKKFPKLFPKIQRIYLFFIILKRLKNKLYII